MFKELAKAGEHDITVKKLCVNGSSLKRWANRHTVPGKKLYKALTHQNWDYVILQDKSTMVLDHPEMFQKSIKKLTKLISDNGSELVLNMTWAHQYGADVYDEYDSLTKRKFQKKLAAMYLQTGEKYGALVAKTGMAFWNCEQQNENIRLYVDERHPSKAGSYLSACTLYATIFQENIPEKDLQLKAEVAEKLRKIAEDVTFTDMGEF